MIRRIVNNFYLRNLAVMIIFISPDVLQSLAVLNKIGWVEAIGRVSSKVFIFAYFLFHNKVLYECLLRKKKYFLYAVSFLASLIIWREGTSYLFWYLTKPASETVYQFRELKDYNVVFWIFIYWANIVYAYIGLGVYFAFHYFRERQALLEIEHQKKELELRQLKEQLNPHFLFNALNNIYSYSLEQADRTGELLLKLSDMLRFILQKSALDLIPLQEEISFIEDYIAFEQERLGSRCAISFAKRISVSHQVAPFILFTFVENAFKHSTAHIGTSDLAISLVSDKSHLSFTVFNTIAPAAPATSTGLGLDNVKRRLDILYPGRHTLNMGPMDGIYTVTLQLQPTA